MVKYKPLIDWLSQPLFMSIFQVKIKELDYLLKNDIILQKEGKKFIPNSDTN
jgi:hypothetical protein